MFRLGARPKPAPECRTRLPERRTHGLERRTSGCVRGVSETPVYLLAGFIFDQGSKNMGDQPAEQRASAPIFDDKAHVRGKLDLTNAEWQRAAEPDADPEGEYVEI